MAIGKAEAYQLTALPDEPSSVNILVFEMDETKFFRNQALAQHANLCACFAAIENCALEYI
jgi:hypothetical protein